MNIAQIPLNELLSDWDDIALCFLALKTGVVTYGQNESVHRRLIANLNVANRITDELLRRVGEPE